MLYAGILVIAIVVFFYLYILFPKRTLLALALSSVYSLFLFTIGFNKIHLILLGFAVMTVLFWLGLGKFSKNSMEES